MESLSNPVAMQNFPTGKPAKAGKYYQENPNNFNKMATCSHYCPLRNSAPSLGHWYTGVNLWIFDPGPSNPTTFLGSAPPVTTGSL